MVVTMEKSHDIGYLYRINVNGLNTALVYLNTVCFIVVL